MPSSSCEQCFETAEKRIKLRSLIVKLNTQLMTSKNYQSAGIKKEIVVATRQMAQTHDLEKVLCKGCASEITENMEKRILQLPDTRIDNCKACGKGNLMLKQVRAERIDRIKNKHKYRNKGPQQVDVEKMQKYYKNCQKCTKPWAKKVSDDLFSIVMKIRLNSI
jgi:hypothetical protein